MKHKDAVRNGFQSLATFDDPERQGTVEMSVYNFLGAGAEYWELWHGDGQDRGLCNRIQRELVLAEKLGREKYKETLELEGKFGSSKSKTSKQTQTDGKK